MSENKPTPKVEAEPPKRPEPTPSTHHVPARESGSNDAAQGLGGHSKDVPHEKTGG